MIAGGQALDSNMRRMMDVTPEEAEKLKYTAISYSCGHFKHLPQKDILVNNAWFGVSANLWHLLNQLSAECHDNMNLWTDAICIDPDNMQEKSIQVAMMTEVFSQCERGIMWLGIQDVVFVPSRANGVVNLVVHPVCRKGEMRRCTWKAHVTYHSHPRRPAVIVTKCLQQATIVLLQSLREEGSTGPDIEVLRRNSGACKKEKQRRNNVSPKSQ